MPQPYEFVLIPKSERAGRASSDYSSQIESAQATGCNLPIDDENFGSSKKQVVGTQITMDKGDGALLGLPKGLGNRGKEMLDLFHILFR